MADKTFASAWVALSLISTACVTANGNVEQTRTAGEGPKQSWCSGGREVGSSGLQIGLPSEINWSDRLRLPVQVYNRGNVGVWIPTNFNLRLPDNLPRDGQFEVRLIRKNGTGLEYVGSRDVIFPSEPAYHVLKPGAHIETVLILDAAEFSPVSGTLSLNLCYDDQTENIPAPPAGVVRERSRIVSREVLIKKE